MMPTIFCPECGSELCKQMDGQGQRYYECLKTGCPNDGKLFWGYQIDLLPVEKQVAEEPKPKKKTKSKRRKS